MFSNVFLGEIFSAIVSLHNQSDQTLREVILKVRSRLSLERARDLIECCRQIFKQPRSASP